MEQKPVVEMEFVKVDSIKEEVEEETPLAGVQPAAVWQEEMEQKPVVEMEFVKVDSIKEEVEEETPLAGVQPAAVWQAGDNPAVETSSLAGASRTRASYSGEGSACLKTECVPEDDTQAETATCGTSLMSDICVSVSTDCKGLHHHQHLCSSSKQDKDAPIIRQEPLEEMEQKPVVEMEFVCVDSIKEEVEEETPLAGVQPAAVWQEEMEQKPVVEMEFVKVDSIKEEVEEETPLAGVQPAAVWQAGDNPAVETISLAGASRTRASYSGEGSACLKTECVPEDDTQAETATCGTSLMSDICVSVSTDCKCLHHHQHLCSSSKQDKEAPIIRQEPLVRHLVEYNISLTGERPFKCEVCNKSFARKHNFQRHKRVHTGERRKCEFCSKSFSSETDLIVHNRTHTGERSFKCELCGKSLSSNTCLILHNKLHTGERPFKCELCGKTFSFKRYLDMHIRVHTGNHPFKCDVCSKSFSCKRDIITHIRLHTGERPFKCNVCSKSYVRREVFNAHYRLHRGENAIKCELCSKSFSCKAALRVHNRLHTGECPFNCDMCSKSFSVKEKLITHMKVHTGEGLFK
ncbi:zinc finger protein 73-like isoform X2 [Bacillus rossius redtenbacheri]|uniref:zinc finger protein 73-like isoform X2 n=3 Tax=Bacillus rossius redtenbacheri TaxID=93214 RepID=UPI002FDE87F1